MYGKKDQTPQKRIKFVCIKDLVPENHFLQEVERSLDFSFIYDKVKGM